MKKIFTLIATALATMTMSAQSLVFCDKDGNVYDEGATIEMTEIEESDFADFQINLSGVYIKNTSSSNVSGTFSATIENDFYGEFGCCFGTNCQMITGSYEGMPSETEFPATVDVPVALTGGQKAQINNTEWYGVEGVYGVLPVKFELKAGDETATLNVNFIYADPAGINDITTSANDSRIYNLSGQQMQQMQKGINIVNGKKYIK